MAGSGLVILCILAGRISLLISTYCDKVADIDGRATSPGGQPMSTDTTLELTIDAEGPIPVTFNDTGSGHTFLLLHGGARPQSVTGFANLLATTHDARVITPTHPGFGGTPRPERIDSIKVLAGLYGALLDRLDLENVTVIGNSIG